MIAFPPAKLNLGLHIIRKREDGFHDLQTAFIPIPLYDVLELVADPAMAPGQDPLFSQSGIPVEGPPEKNICLRAYHLLRRDFPQLPGIRMHLHKVIPMGAGLGGGSSDGAHTLMLLNALGKLGLNEEQLINYALTLGSDCPFFIRGKACFAEGRGERMTPIPLHLRGHTLVVVNPGIHVSTAEAFQAIQPRHPDRSIRDILALPPAQWKGLLSNDFEGPMGVKFPAIVALRDQLYQSGALYAAMSGSGSTVFGIFSHPPESLPDFPPSYTRFSLPLT